VQQKNILNNLDEIKKIDKKDMLSFCVEAQKHFSNAKKIARAVVINYTKPRTIIIAGMGGSAIAGEIIKHQIREKIKVPIEICREYRLPAYANEKTLVFIVSYSGETEETLSAFLDALRRKCMLICISSGGKLLEIAKKLKVPCLSIPLGIPPRAAFLYFFLPINIILERIGLVSNIKPELDEAIEVLKRISSENSPEIQLINNVSKKLASDINGKIPIVYGFGIYSAVTKRFKQQFNENSKVPAKWNVFPELNHNEIVETESRYRNSLYAYILLRAQNEPKGINRHVEAAKEVILKKTNNVHEVWSIGKSDLAKILSTVYLGDFASIYLAILQRVDPTPIKTITSLKEKIKKSREKKK
jgi:glucose/mannose-6-phosphate isomerase